MSTNVYQYLSMCTKVYQCLPISTNDYQCLPKSTDVYQILLMSTNVYQCLPMFKTHFSDSNAKAQYTANQDVHTLTQNSNIILTITALKLQPKQAYIFKMFMSRATKKPK